MWPGKRKRHNQKLRQRNVLDVKASVAQMRSLRLRALTYTTTASLAVLLVLYVAWRTGECVVNKLLYHNTAYALQELDVQTDGVLAAEQIRRWAGIKIGDNLFALDLARVRRDLELVPAIQRVAVERVVPHTLRIRVSEREPVAQILRAGPPQGTNGSRVVFLLDASGQVMLPLDSRQRAIPPQPGEQYPILTGANLAELTPGRPVESPAVRAALSLIAAFDRSPMAGLVDLQRIDVSSPEVLQVSTDQHSEVVLRLSDLEQQLRRWRLIFETGLQQGRQIASLDLSVVDNIPLRWVEAGSVPPPVPKTKKVSPYRKKHV
jgi:cell division protein FtsQ